MASLPGLTRQSISFAKTLTKLMDARVKPGHDRSEIMKGHFRCESFAPIWQVGLTSCA